MVGALWKSLNLSEVEATGWETPKQTVNKESQEITKVTCRGGV